MESTTTTKRPVLVLLPPEHWKAIRQESLDTGRSGSAIVRDLVANHLRKKQVKQKSQ